MVNCVRFSFPATSVSDVIFDCTLVNVAVGILAGTGIDIVLSPDALYWVPNPYTTLYIVKRKAPNATHPV